MKKFWIVVAVFVGLIVLYKVGESLSGS